jgi:hypothetical protein
LFESDLKSFSYLPQSNLSIDSFLFSNSKELDIKKRIEEIGTPLKDWDIKIYRGILTGFNEAFIIDSKTKDELIAKDSKSAEIIKPILRGRDVKKYSYEFADLYLINSHNNPPIDINKYPAIKEHLDRFYPQLEKRTDKGATAYNLRNCAYLEEFKKEKIVYPETTQFPDVFTIDSKKYFIDKTCFMIIGNNLKCINALLNSKVLISYMKQTIRQLGIGFQLSKIFVELLPIPKISEKEMKPFEVLVNKIIKLKSKNKDTKELENKIDKMVYELYNFSEEDIRIVEHKN